MIYLVLLKDYWGDEGETTTVERAFKTHEAAANYVRNVETALTPSETHVIIGVGLE